MSQSNVLLVMILCILNYISCQDKFEPTHEELVANAGNDQITLTGSYAVFDPTKSRGDYNWYDWQQDEGNPAEVKLSPQSKDIKDEWNIQKVGFVKEGNYKFKLIVRTDVTPSNIDGTNASEPDELNITVNPNLYSRFVDPNLEIMVRIALEKQIDELTESVLLELDSLQFMPTPQRVSSLEGLEFCRNLLNLNLGLQDISDISPLASLTKLRKLALDQNRKISDITPLAGLTDLEWLNLDSNLITDISALNNLVRLKYLNLQLNSIESINAIKNMLELETLFLFRAKLENISAVSNLIELTQLWIPDCGVRDISYLEKLTNINKLHLAWNQITNIQPLSNIKGLEWVALEKNNISDISPLSDLPNLRYVRLWDNQITNIKPLVDNTGIGKGDIVGLDGNPLDEVSINECIPALLSRGVVVTW